MVYDWYHLSRIALLNLKKRVDILYDLKYQVSFGVSVLHVIMNEYFGSVDDPGDVQAFRVVVPKLHIFDSIFCEVSSYRR